MTPSSKKILNYRLQQQERDKKDRGKLFHNIETEYKYLTAGFLPFLIGRALSA